MKRSLRRLFAALLSAALLAGMCITASAFTYPSAYWPLQDAWLEAVANESVDQTISVAQEIYDLLIPYGLGESVCYNLEPKCAKAAWCSEMKGDLQGAITWLQRERTLAEWLDGNVRDYSDTLLNIDARLEYLNAAASPAIYALTENSAASYAGAPASGTWYGSNTGGSQNGESAVLMYVNFLDGYSVEYWIDYFKRTSDKFEQAVTNGGVIELAWNFSPESTAGVEKVLSSAADSYIAEGVKAIGALDATVLLRVGAEMNNWNDCDPAKFIQAFRKIAAEASQYSNIQMVFSPDNINNRNVTFQEFYPGDQYVDWIGMSTYHGTNYAGEAPAYTYDASGYGNDAYYGRGLYDSDPLVIIGPIVRFAQAHGKPVMVSECGFGYWNNATGTDQTAFAVEQVTKFYSYVNMIYPQVKAVFYFDNNVAGETYCYELSGNSAVAAAYRSAIANNGAYLAQGETGGKNWQSLDQVKEAQSGTLKLATYASFPGSAAVTVKYYLDGNQAASTSQAPYYYELNTAALTPGRHTIKATATSGQFSQTTASYEITVAERAPAEEQGGFQVSAASSWARDLLRTANDNQLVTERTSTGFQKQITRLQFAELAVNLIEQVTGQAITPSTEAFVDTGDAAALKAVAAGITAGSGEGRFSPDAPITRQEICVMLNQVIRCVDEARGTTTLKNTSTEIDARFTDAGSVASWARPAVARLTNNGLMSGNGSQVAPLSNTTVEEAIVLILALYNNF